MKKTMIVGALGALLCAAAGAQAQTPAPAPAPAAAPAASLLPTTGTKEIGLTGFYDFNNGSPYSLTASYGVFTSPVLEFGAEGSVSGASGTDTFTSIGAFADYYFTGLGGSTAAATALAPYIGAFIGYSHVVDSTTSYGGEAGIKYFFNPNVALNAGYRYQSASHANLSEIFLGLSTFFR